MIAGWHPQVPIRGGSVDDLDFAKQAIFQVGWDFPGFSILAEDVAQPAIP
jgi:hypothetical protein